MAFWGASIRTNSSEPLDLEGLQLFLSHVVLENPDSVDPKQWVTVYASDEEERIALCLLNRQNPQMKLDLAFSDSVEFFVSGGSATTKVSLSGSIEPLDDGMSETDEGSDAETDEGSDGETDEETAAPELMMEDDTFDSDSSASELQIEEIKDNQQAESSSDASDNEEAESDSEAQAESDSDETPSTESLVKADVVVKKDTKEDKTQAVQEKLSKRQAKKLRQQQRLAAEAQQEAQAKASLTPGVKKTLPGGVTYEVLKNGAPGREAGKGKRATVAYQCRLARSGKQVDQGQLAFRVGAGEMIKGFDMVVEGMKINEKRRALVPSRFAYGSKGAAPEIPPNSDLIFEVELKKIQ